MKIIQFHEAGIINLSFFNDLNQIKHIIKKIKNSYSIPDIRIYTKNRQTHPFPFFKIITRSFIFGKNMDLSNVTSTSVNLQQIMNSVRQLFKRAWQGRKAIIQYWKKSPSSKIILINSGVYCMWKLKIIPEDFLVKHFSAERFNLQGGRLHTLLTYSFSHMGIFSLFFDMLMVGLMGRAIQSAYGNKYIYWLYGLGAIFGGMTASVFKLPTNYIHPQVGAESVVAAYLTFLGLLNPHQTFMLFFFPMRAWVLLLLMGGYSLVFDPQKKVFAGMTAGMTVYQMMRVGFL